MYVDTVTAKKLNQIDKLNIFFRGYKLGFIGEIQSGKTTLIDYIYQGKYDLSFRPTQKDRPLKGCLLKINNSKVIKLKEILDLGGEDRFLSKQKKSYKRANIVIYIIRSDVLIGNSNYKDELEGKIKDHYRLMSSWFNILGQKPKLIVVANYFYKTQDAKRSSHLDPTFKAEFEKKIMDIASQSKNITVEEIVHGSMSTQILIKELVNNIFGEL